MAALGVGLVATVTPALLAAALAPRGSYAEDVGWYVGVGVGAIAGPAVGMWSGGRGDLAKRGLVVRIISGTLIGAGGLGVVMATGNDGGGDQSVGAILVILGMGGVAAMTWSMFHDLAITPSATAQGRPLSAGLGIRSDGLLVARVRF